MDAPMDVVLASNNPHKLEEIRGHLPAGVNLRSAAEFNLPSPPETGLTFVENAILKARHAARLTGLPALADDSGLEVEALGGAPGIYSARYAGPDATDADNNHKLLAELAGNDMRAACFRCVIVLLRHEKDPMPIIATGTWRGEILAAQKGENGFGYDPLFFLPDLGKTAAELSSEEKRTLSHRGLALKELHRQFNHA